MTTLSLEQPGASLRDMIDLLRQGPVVITEHGRPVMTVLAVDEDDAFAWSMGQSRELMAVVQEARQELRETGGLSLAEMRRNLGLPPN